MVGGSPLNGRLLSVSIPCPLFIRPGTRDNRNVWDTAWSLDDNGASVLSSHNYQRPVISSFSQHLHLLVASEKYWRTRRGEMMDPSIVMVKRALRSVVVAEIDIMWLIKVLPGAFRIFLCFGQCHCMHPPSLSGAWSKCFSTRWAKLLLSVETFTLMKTCCTFLARPEVCQVRREVSLCPLGSKIGHKCKILSKLETFQRATQKCLVSSRNGHFMRRGHWEKI